MFSFNLVKNWTYRLICIDESKFLEKMVLIYDDPILKFALVYPNLNNRT